MNATADGGLIGLQSSLLGCAPADFIRVAGNARATLWVVGDVRALAGFFDSRIRRA